LDALTGGGVGNWLDDAGVKVLYDNEEDNEMG
jgi:hypothetical protein